MFFQYFYQLRLVTLFNDPVPSPKFKFVEWLVFHGMGTTCSDKFGNSFRQSLLCGSALSSSARDTATKEDLEKVLEYFLDYAVDGRLSDEDMWTLMNREKQLFGRIDAHVTKIHFQRELAGFGFHSLNVSNSDTAKRVEFIMLPFYKAYVLGSAKPIPMFHHNVFPDELSDTDLIYCREEFKNRLMLFRMKVHDRFEFRGFPDIASHTGTKIKFNRRPSSWQARVFSEEEMTTAFRTHQGDWAISENAQIHYIPWRRMPRTTPSYRSMKKLPAYKGIIPPYVYELASLDEESSNEAEPSGPGESDRGGSSGSGPGPSHRVVPPRQSRTPSASPSHRSGPSVPQPMVEEITQAEIAQADALIKEEMGKLRNIVVEY
ncbi:hypothetical protein HA402_003835 [Bradysia odoriphaga]|nr:hypothetical protein HA402_003835 [Bradysia odoriphaga]